MGFQKGLREKNIAASSEGVGAVGAFSADQCCLSVRPLAVRPVLSSLREAIGP